VPPYSATISEAHARTLPEAFGGLLTSQPIHGDGVRLPIDSIERAAQQHGLEKGERRGGGGGSGGGDGLTCHGCARVRVGVEAEAEVASA